MLKGSIKLFRKIINTSIYQDSEMVHLFIHLLLCATETPIIVKTTNESFTLSEGQLVTTHTRLSNQTGINRSKIQRFLKILQEENMISINSGQTATIITILKYNTYQSQEEEEVEYTPEKSDTKTKIVFESLWSQYPRKDGKKEAQRHYSASVKTEADIFNIHKALENYLLYTQKKYPDGDLTYVKKGATWFNNWEDWLDLDMVRGLNKQTNIKDRWTFLKEDKDDERRDLNEVIGLYV